MAASGRPPERRGRLGSTLGRLLRRSPADEPIPPPFSGRPARDPAAVGDLDRRITEALLAPPAAGPPRPPADDARTPVWVRRLHAQALEAPDPRDPDRESDPAPDR